MKTVFLKSRFQGMKLHSLYENLTAYPPEGYNITQEKSNIENPFTNRR